MTTIVYRDGVLAGDTLVSMNGGRYGQASKVFRGDDGVIGGAAGDLSGVDVLGRWIAGGSGDRPSDYSGDVSGIVVYPSGQILVWDGRHMRPIRAQFVSEGSGWQFAFGAMAMGADAVRALEVAMQYDTGTGGEIEVVRL